MGKAILKSIEDFKASKNPCCCMCGVELSDLNRSDVVNVCFGCLRDLER